MKNSYHAFVQENVEIMPTQSGELSGLSFAVKDVYNIKGVTASAGNPDWLRTHKPASSHASSIECLLNHGAKLKGTTITDELMYSLNGENVHYGTPINPKDPRRIPGGSSSGSAVAVGAKLVDFSLGTDTGGSVRIPASYCGIYGYRPSHGAVCMDGVIPLAPSFDTVGWMAREPELLLTIGKVLLKGSVSIQEDTIGTMLIGRDAWTLADERSRTTLAPILSQLKDRVTHFDEVTISEEGLSEWMDVFRILQGIEIWESHGTWIETVHPTFGPDIAERFHWASTLNVDERETKNMIRKKINDRMSALLSGNKILVVPTVPGIASFLNQTGQEIEKRRAQTLQLSCIAGLAGLPQVTIPVAQVEGAPLGISVIAGRHQDLSLLQWVVEHKKIWQKCDET
ncbi:amidase [Bacillus alkalicellulosilyticus]|uniref:amidase n=1 Tax=Alkalihalobacterium alkalicellulosilyticum TaxID=1912214 RepID=UPI0009985D56|nr:amidase [Bacillus alkalicellulosilyticus]